MRKITPYKSYRYALASLDNGGRFYNLRSKANDGDITSAELGKAAGVFSDRQKMILYLEMSLLDLEAEMRAKVYSHLSDDLKAMLSRLQPAIYSPAEANQKAEVSQSAIITGIPRLIDSKTRFTGFIMVPISTGDTTTFTMIPIFDQYDVYELTDADTEEDFFIAHNRSSRKLPEQLIRCGGVIKELKGEKDQEPGKFLEMLYYAV